MKVMTLRYPDELEDDIKTVAELGGYSPSKTLTITRAIIVAAGYIKKVQKLKSIKDEYSLGKKVEEELSVKIPWYNNTGG